MKRKRFLLIGLLVAALVLLTFPAVVGANGDYDYCDNVCLCKKSMEVPTNEREWELEALKVGECGIVKICVNSYCPYGGYYYECVTGTVKSFVETPKSSS